jgi:UDP-N-acetylmuramyl pentapeptide synthase
LYVIPKSYNSQIGVPLSVWQINGRNDLGIFEAGISTVNEMDKLEAIIKPEIGVLTHIGTAHDEGFKNRREKVLEKLKLFKNSQG